MKFFQLAITFAFLLFGFTYSVFAQNCKDNSRKENEKAVCVQSLIDLGEIKTNTLEGKVIFNNLPFEDAVVEVYKILPKNNEEVLIASYKTEKEGKFCFKNIPKGTYKIRVGWIKFGFNCSEIKVKLKGNIKRRIEIPINLAT